MRARSACKMKGCYQCARLICPTSTQGNLFPNVERHPIHQPPLMCHELRADIRPEVQRALHPFLNIRHCLQHVVTPSHPRFQGLHLLSLVLHEKALFYKQLHPPLNTQQSKQSSTGHEPRLIHLYKATLSFCKEEDAKLLVQDVINCINNLTFPAWISAQSYCHFRKDILPVYQDMHERASRWEATNGPRAGLSRSF